MATIEEIIEFIVEGKGKTFNEIVKHFDEHEFELSEKLRYAETKGFIVRKNKKEVEIWAP